MQNLFARANEALYQDLDNYATTLRHILEALPQAKMFCEQVVYEVRLVQALLAFGSGPTITELSRLVLQIDNLWAVRDQLPARTAGFSNEIAESERAREQARRGLALAEKSGNEALGAELRTCFTNIQSHLEAQQRLLEECNARLLPFSGSPDLTRKRLNLLIAAAEARLPASPERSAIVRTYSEAVALLGEWGDGITLDEHGLAVVERCLEILRQNGETFGMLNVPAPGVQ